MGTRVEWPRTVNFDIPHQSFKVILLITFQFQHFLTRALRHNPYIMEFLWDFSSKQGTIKKRHLQQK